ncbi:MAG: enolase C-terminal domain-like protein, partial [Candidatus Paceibacterota bacterium]
KAAAHSKRIEVFEHLGALAGLPAPRSVPLLYMNYINGGKHATTPLSFQEHMIVPQTDSISEAIDIAHRFEAALISTIDARYGENASHSMGDEGGFVIQEKDPHEPFRLLTEAAMRAGVIDSIRIAIDAAASSFFADGIYTVGGTHMDTARLLDLYHSLAAEFPLISIEDPFNEDAMPRFAALQSSLDIRVVGDDLTVTSAERIASAARAGAIRAVIVKPNQVGTLSETLDAVRAAKENGIDVIVSHRSGETDDDFIADLAYAVDAFGLKAGALRRPERVAKYERLRVITERT